MPYVKLSELSKPRRDRLKADLLERQLAYNKTNEDMAAAMGISRSTYQRLLKQHTEEWTVKQLTAAFHEVGVRLHITSDAQP